MLNPWVGLLLAVPITVVLLMIGNSRGDPSWAALAGAITASVGVLTVGRPIIRLGYAEWLKRSEVIDGGGFEPTPAEQREALERQRDAQAIQLSGPLLIIAGTLLNGASGFLG